MTRHNPTSQRASRRREAQLDHDEPDIRDTDWHRFIETIDALLADDDLAWAAPTLRAIQQTVTEQQHLTQAQAEAVAHIAVGWVLSGWPYLTRPGRVR